LLVKLDLRVRHSLRTMFVLPLLSMAACSLYAQTGEASQKLAPDQMGCADSKILPRLLECRIDNCERKDPDHREVPVGEDAKGDPINAPIDGKSRSVMYECREGTTPASIVELAATALKAGGFDLPYRFADAEGSITARKDELWILLEAASHYYTVTEYNIIPPDYEAATDADSIAQILERYGHVPLYGIKFLPGRPELEPSSVTIMGEVITMLRDHPTWRLRVECHTDNVGTPAANLTLSLRRATVVTQWLATNGIKKLRLDPQGIGDAHPVADNLTEPGRMRNRRIELVKLPDQDN
jgi:outer membrane protein OmpA-like peptidoglycan-associated protein